MKRRQWIQTASAGSVLGSLGLLSGCATPGGAGPKVVVVGGGFGGKETQAATPAALAALAAHVTGRPARMRFNRDQDMMLTGKRHPFLYRWRAGFDATGRITGLEAMLAADGGHSLDLTGGVVFRSLTHALNCYDVPAVKLRALSLRTLELSLREAAGDAAALRSGSEALVTEIAEARGLLGQ
jgi:xanthine dehydrogenase large subunit